MSWNWGNTNPGGDRGNRILIFRGSSYLLLQLFKMIVRAYVCSRSWCKLLDPVFCKNLYRARAIFDKLLKVVTTLFPWQWHASKGQDMIYWFSYQYFWSSLFIEAQKYVAKAHIYVQNVKVISSALYLPRLLRSTKMSGYSQITNTSDIPDAQLHISQPFYK